MLIEMIGIALARARVLNDVLYIRASEQASKQRRETEARVLAYINNATCRLWAALRLLGPEPRLSLPPSLSLSRRAALLFYTCRYSRLSALSPRDSRIKL